MAQERLGHNNIAMTLDLYSHVSMDMQRDAIERLDEALGSQHVSGTAVATKAIRPG